MWKSVQAEQRACAKALGQEELRTTGKLEKEAGRRKRRPGPDHAGVWGSFRLVWVGEGDRKEWTGWG